MKKRIFVVTLFIIFSLVCLAACSSNTPTTFNEPDSSANSSVPTVDKKAVDHDRVVNFAYHAILQSFDMSVKESQAEAISFGQVYDSLIEMTSDGKLVPSLAKSWEVSDDGMVYTFHLQEGVKWTDGVDFTAEDVGFTFRRLSASPEYAFIYDVNVADYEVVDDLTIKLIMKSPNAAFLNSLASPMFSCVMAKHAFDKWGDEYGSSVDKIVGTGAYIVTDWQPNVSITYVANENYFKGAPSIKNIAVHAITDTNAAIVALQTGELDVYFVPVAGGAYETLSNSPNVTVSDFLSARDEGIYMNYNKGIFSDVRMRRAVAHAINKEDALLIAQDGLGDIIRYYGDHGSSMTANPLDYQPNITYDYDLEKARKLVEEAGYKGAKVTVNSYNTDPFAILNTYIQSVLVDIGLDASSETMERGAFIAKLNDQEVEICPFAYVGQTYDIDEVLCGSLHSQMQGKGNYSFYNDAEMDKMITTVRAIPDLAERTEYYKKIIDKFMEDIPFVPLYAVRAAIPYSSDLTTDNPRSWRMYDFKWAE